MHECRNCNYEGEDIIKDKFCPICGDYIIGKVPTPSQVQQIAKEEALVRQKALKAHLDKQAKELESKIQDVGDKIVLPITKEEVNLDLNNDGKVDKEDASIASKVLHKIKGNKRKRGKR